MPIGVVSWIKTHKFGGLCCAGAFLSLAACCTWEGLAIRSYQVREQSLLLNITPRGDEYQYWGETVPSLVAFGVGLAGFLAAAANEILRRRPVDAIHDSLPATSWFFLLVFLFTMLSEGAFP